MKIGSREFDCEHQTYIMGILNVTPDSFSDGGRWNQVDAALHHAEEMLQEGAAVIDVGGESTRPGHVQISDSEEIERVAPVIEALRNHFEAPISIDTYKYSVAEAAIGAGADMVNDIWGFKYDSRLAGLVARTGAACCLMHNKENAVYGNFLEDMIRETRECVEIARKAGVGEDRIILDPGVGFGKTFEMNLEMIRRLGDFRQAFAEYPVLLGTSRKSVIGLALSLPSDQRLEGTLATTVMAVQAGCSFLRVHDVRENERVVRMTRAILGMQ